MPIVQTPNDYKANAAAEALSKVYLLLLEVAAKKRQGQEDRSVITESGKEQKARSEHHNRDTDEHST